MDQDYVETEYAEAPPAKVAQVNQMTEAGFSLNFRILDGNGTEVTVTMRGETCADWRSVITERAAFMKQAQNSGWTPIALRQAPVQMANAAPQKAATAPQPVKAAPVQPAQTQRPVAGNTGNSFHATKVKVVVSEDGKRSGKMFGGKFTQYGVRLWPEAAEVLGWNLDEMELGEYECDLDVAYLVNEKGQPTKVTGLATG